MSGVGWVVKQRGRCRTARTVPAPPADEARLGAGRGADPAVTDGTLLGGRVAYRQFRDSYRTGLEPVLLAASVRARSGLRVVEAGCGAGAGLLCLSARLAADGVAVHGTGIERDPATAALARLNLDRNHRPGWPVLTETLQAVASRPPPMRFDWAIANPPWHRGDATASPDPRRDLARRAHAGLLEDWCLCLSRLLRTGGRLTLALPAALQAEATAALVGARFGTIRLLPLWPRSGVPARLVLVEAVLGGRGDSAVLPGLVLHRPEGGFTEALERVLREGAPLPLG